MLHNITSPPLLFWTTSLDVADRNPSLMHHFCAFLAILKALNTREFFVKTLEFRNIFLHSPLVNF